MLRNSVSPKIRPKPHILVGFRVLIKTEGYLRAWDLGLRLRIQDSGHGAKD